MERGTACGPDPFILAILAPARRGTRYFGRGAPGEKPVFHVIEFWVENRLMIEVATPDMVDEYTRVIQREALEAAFGRHVAA